MQRMIPVDKLARPEDHVLLPAERLRRARVEQGLTPTGAMPYEADFLKARLHGICAGEFQAMEAAGRTLFDFPDAPWEFQLDMARPVWDESRHAEIFQRLIEYMGAHPGDYVATEILWRCTQANDPAARVAGINRGLEGLACDVFDQLIRIAQKNGDEVIERSVDYVLAAEITHVRMGSKWMRKLTEGDPERLKTAQAFRPHILDMFEPQDHPNDFQYAGGPPIPPYDITGWTLAMQMGVQYDRELDAFDGPFAEIKGLATPPAGTIAGPASPAGYLISHRTNDQFVVVNRLLKAGADVYWVGGDQSAGGAALGTGAIWVPASAAARPILETAAKTPGVDVYGVANAPAGAMLKLKAPRIGLVDVYGGLMPVGWARWLFEQYGFAYDRIYPQALDAGNLNAKYDVIVLMDGAYRRREASRAGEMRAGSGEGLPAGMDASMIPAEYRGWLGRISEDKTAPQLKEFVEAGGTVLAIGSSTGLGELLGVPVTNHLTEIDRGAERPLPPDKFYIPGSLLQVSVDNTDPLAYGMPDHVDVVFDNSPVFRMDPDAAQRHATAVAWFASPKVLQSGWAWGQQYLDGGAAAVDASVGRGRVILLGPKVTFRGQPHATFKLLFNGIYAPTNMAPTVVP